MINLKGKPLDYEMYYINMTKSDALSGMNPKLIPKWEFEYRASESYHLKDLSPKSWHKFAEEAMEKIDLAELYYQHFHRYSEVFPYKTTDKMKKMVQQIKVQSPLHKHGFEK